MALIMASVYLQNVITRTIDFAVHVHVNTLGIIALTGPPTDVYK